ncbi:MAG: putative oxidoreductase [Caloramator sp.]|jgi:glycine/D-amino acid oxidase-like deaminating enzyme|uniref:NAD(P)/FAD-dependent oxidoreductase n=1 Tax=Caloramator sp. TaxID=1871330 RepID=UPI001DC37846|nr:FAD-dependent oxidoreductase [Caloramator sp.]MBZ4663193.1 putative oxidoreductase [Caloramator sp.]
MKLVSYNPIWTNKNPVLNKYTYLSKNEDCDILIIGGGITGAILSYYLSFLGKKIILVDKNIIGYGSTSASTSILQYEVDFDILELEKKIGIVNALKAYKANEAAVYEIERIIKTLKDKCDFTKRESLYFTQDKSKIQKFKEEYKIRRAADFDIEFLDKNTAKDKFSFPIEAAIYSKCGGAEIDPYRFAHELIKDSQSRGLIVYENTAILKYQHKNNKVILFTDKHKKITAQKVVVATGYQAKNLIKENIVKLNTSFTIATKPVSSFEGWYDRCIIRNDCTPYNYLRTTQDNRIIIGGEDIPIINPPQIITQNKYQKLEQRLCQMFPNINFEVDYKFHGLFGDTKDGLPYIGVHPKFKNFYFALGYGSNGILYSIIAGQIIRDMISEEKIHQDIHMYGFRR